MPKVSIIMPVYNAEKYLDRSLESVLGQTEGDIELICVNDGSTDRSKEILDEYGLKDQRIKVFHRENCGSGIARNFAVRNAVGDFVMFIDADDYYRKDAVSEAYKRITESGADVTAFNAWDYEEKTGRKIDHNYIRLRLLKEGQDEVSIKEPPENVFDFLAMNCWSRIFRTEFLHRNDLLFDELRSFEDIGFAIRTMCMANKITWVDKRLYFYRNGEDKSLKSIREGEVENLGTALINLKKWLKDKGFLENPVLERSIDRKAVSLFRYLSVFAENFRTYDLFVKYLSRTGFKLLEIEDLKPGYLVDASDQLFYDHVKTESSGDLLLDSYAAANRERLIQRRFYVDAKKSLDREILKTHTLAADVDRLETEKKVLEDEASKQAAELRAARNKLDVFKLELDAARNELERIKSPGLNKSVGMNKRKRH